MKKILISAFLILFAQYAFSQATFTWTGSGTNSNWSNPDNWSISGVDDDSPTDVPDGDDDVIISVTSSTKVPQVNSDQGVDDLSITIEDYTFAFNAGVVVQTGHSLDINGNLNINQIAGSAFFRVFGTAFIGGSISTSGGGQFIPQSGSTIEYDGISNQTIFPTSYYTLNVDKPGSTALINSNSVVVNTALNITQGTLSIANRILTVSGSMTISNGATFASGASGSLIFNGTGTLTNNGTFTSNTGSVTFEGSTDFTGSTTTTFYNIIVDGELDFEGGTAILSNLMTFTSTSNVDFDGDYDGGSFTILSSSTTTTARLGNTNGATLTGEITMQRYLEGNDYWVYFTSPLIGVTVQDLMGELAVTGNFEDDSDPGDYGTLCDECGDTPSLVWYDETVGGNNTEGYVPFPYDGGTDDTVFVKGRGYSMWVRQEFTPLSIDLAGTVHEPSSFTFNSSNELLTHTSTEYGYAHDGWNIIGNPYLSPITVNQGWSSSNTGNYVYVKDNTGSRGAPGTFYYAFFGGGGSEGWDGTIAIGQGVWALATGSNPSITVSQDAKTTDATFFERTKEVAKIFRVLLNKEGSTMDEAMFRFADTGEEEFDPSWDIPKLWNDHYNISSFSSDGEYLAANNLPSDFCSIEVDLYLSEYNPQGEYSLSFSGINTFGEGFKATLIDSYADKTIEVDESTIYEFVQDENPASSGSDRFKVVLVMNDLNLNDLSVEIPEICEGEDGSIKIVNAQAGVTYSLENDGNMITSATAEGNELIINIPVENIPSSGEVNILASNSCSSDVTIPGDFVVNVIEKPVSPSVINGYTCGVGTVILEASSDIEGEFRWYKTNEVTETPLQEGNDATYTVDVLEKSSTYYVSVVNSTGCESERTPVEAEIRDLPEPQITRLDEFNLSSNYETGNQWYFNNELISGATDQILKIDESGVYELEVTQDECSARIEKSLIVTGLHDDLDEFGVEVSPNPITDIVTINTGSLTNPHLHITTIEGKVKYTQHLKQGVNQVDLSRLDHGIYLLKLRSRRNQVVLRIVKN